MAIVTGFVVHRRQITFDALDTETGGVSRGRQPWPAGRRASQASRWTWRLQLPQDPRERIAIALAMIDAIEAQVGPLERELRQLARRQTRCRAWMGTTGWAKLTSLVTLCEVLTAHADVSACGRFRGQGGVVLRRTQPVAARTPCPRLAPPATWE